MSKLGLTITQTEAAEDVPRLLRQKPKATIVVYSPEGRRAAETVLGQVARARRSTRVIVLVNDSDFSEYYSLMNQGAVEYFEVREAPSVIARGVEWAARRRAA